MNQKQAHSIVENLSDKQKEELQVYLMRRKPYLWIAKRLKISAIAVRNFDIINNKRYVVSEDGYGKDTLRPFIISRRYVDNDWPAMDDLVINKARDNYDAGTVEMVTARDGFYQILYSIPREIIAKNRKPYFTRSEENATIP